MGKAKKQYIKEIHDRVKDYNGYDTAVDKKASELSLKAYLLEKFRNFSDKISVIQDIALSSQMIMIWGDLDTLKDRIRAEVAYLEHIIYAGSSFFMGDDHRDQDIEIIEREVAALDFIEQIDGKLKDFSDSVDSALLSSIPEINSSLLKLFDGFHKKWTSRQEIITEYRFL